MIPQVYITIPRGRNPADYLRTAAEVVRWTVDSGLDGILFFAGAGAYLDPWLSATSLVATTTGVTPMIAVNPAYVHPVTAASFVNTIANLHGRRVALNYIAGTSLSELSAIGEQLDHGARYRRLAEYAQVVAGLLGSSRPLDFDGEYYQLSRVQVLPQLPAPLLPELFLAGQSDDARRVAQDIGASTISMLAGGDAGGVGARHFGVCTRPDAGSAWAAAAAAFPTDDIGAAMQRLSLADTDASWKHRLLDGSTPAQGAYWTGPFENGHADCPYIVDDHDGVADLLRWLGAAGVHTVILD
ncbi:MAG: LLM class flavin-dependent oxidoreductase, partial [Jatrophihabitantaceae bacterium]